MPKRKKRRSQRGTFADRLGIYLDREMALQGAPEAGPTIASPQFLDAWRKRADLATAFDGIFAEPGGLLEISIPPAIGFGPPEFCWLWKGNTVNGRPRMSVDGKLVFVTRWVYARVYGPPPDGTIVTRRCGRLQCIRPSHLILVPQGSPPYMAKRQQKYEPRGFWSNSRGQQGV